MQERLPLISALTAVADSAGTSGATVAIFPGRDNPGFCEMDFQVHPTRCSCPDPRNWL